MRAVDGKQEIYLEWPKLTCLLTRHLATAHAQIGQYADTVNPRHTSTIDAIAGIGYH